MAGIGFQLRKIIGKGSLGGTVGAIVSGIFIVAGPWLISIVSMIILQFAFIRFRFPGVPVFQATVVYCYAGSLSLFPGMHHHFTRIVADLVWEGRHGEATSWMLRFAVLALLVSVAIAAPVMATVPLSIPGNAMLYRVSVVALFAVINVAWIVMLFVSLLRDYRLVSLVFGLGMALSIAGTLYLAGRLGVGGAVLGYAAGVLLLDVVFIMIGALRYPPVPPEKGFSDFWQYARKYAALIASGFCFYAGQWMDKFYFWAARGTIVAGTPIQVYGRYDFAVYIAGLSIIPGLVYFIVITETQLYTDLRHFLFSLNHSSWIRIQKAKRRIVGSLGRELRDQSLLQAACSLSLAFLLIHFGPAGLSGIEMWLAMGAAYMQFTLLTILVFLYYFELYRKAFLSAFVYFCLNGLGSVIAYSLVPGLPPGASHLAAGFVSSLVAYLMLESAVHTMDRIIFTRSLGA